MTVVAVLLLPDRAALPGLVVPRVPPARDRAPAADRAPGVASSAATRRSELPDARPRPAPAPPHEVGAAAAGARLRRSGSAPRWRCCCRPRCWRGSSRARFDGARCASSGLDLALLVVAFAVRARVRLGDGGRGRRAAWSVLSELRLALVEKRLRAQPVAVDGTERRRDRRRRGAGDRGARGLLRALPAAGRARLGRPAAGDRLGGRGRPRGRR